MSGLNSGTLTGDVDRIATRLQRVKTHFIREHNLSPRVVDLCDQVTYELRQAAERERARQRGDGR